MQNKTTKLIMGMLLLGVIMISFASAEYLACFNKGDKYTYCNIQQNISVYRSNCNSIFCTCMDSPACNRVCVKSYDATRNCYVVGNSQICLGLAPNCSSTSGGNITSDSTPPVLNISNPLNTTTYNSRSLILNFSLNEIADVYYKDLNMNTNSWTMICSKCSVGSISNPSYAKLRSFSEGQNNLLFKAVDLSNNAAYVNVKFLVDSTKPMIYTTTPKPSSYADGNFEVQFKELNPKRITLYYGADKANIDLSKCDNSLSTKSICDINVNLSKYNGQKIPYSFEIEDIAGNTYRSGNISINVNANTVVGNTSLVLTVFNPLNTTLSKSKSVLLNFSVNEIATVYYQDLSKNINSWIKVCDNCAVGNVSNPSYAKLRTFTEGQNNLMLKAVDLANNVSYVNIKFFIDSTVPIIYTTTPKANSFANGSFEVQFKELNPKRVTLGYGTDKVNLNLSKCYVGVSKTICDINVNLSKYNGQNILYYLEIEDITGNTVKSRLVNVSVDTKAPVINNPLSFFKVNGRYVNFNISITDDNFYKVTFIKTNDPRAIQTTLCTTLTNGFCAKNQSFIKGNYSLSIQISDKAGHLTTLPANFNIVY